MGVAQTFPTRIHTCWLRESAIRECFRRQNQPAVLPNPLVTAFRNTETEPLARLSPIRIVRQLLCPLYQSLVLSWLLMKAIIYLRVSDSFSFLINCVRC